MAATVPNYEPGTYLFSLYRYHEEFSDWPLADSLVFLSGLVVAYLAFVLKIGPDYMKNRPPFKLKNTILIYNAIQVILSAMFVYYTLKPMLLSGFFPSTSVQNEDPEIRKMMFWGTYFYFLGKLSELLDTIFFVLRKKYNQVSFLHVYHHASVIVGTWAMVFYSLNHSVLYGFFINSLVHVVMYFYYFMAALGPQYQKYLTWKSYITTFQLVQFASMFAHQVISLVVTKGEHTILGLVYVLCSSTLFFYLFNNFYKSSYNKKPKAEAVKNENGTNVTSNGSTKEE